jgi:H-type lectin domain
MYLMIQGGNAFILAQTNEGGGKIGLLNDCLRFERGTSPIYRLNVSTSTEEDSESLEHLVSRVRKLETQLERLSSQLPEETKVDSGTWTTPYLPPPDRIEQRINFSKTFKSAPVVTVSISGADLDKSHNFRLHIWVTDVDSKGFTVHVNFWDGTKLYQCMISWIAVGN